MPDISNLPTSSNTAECRQASWAYLLFLLNLSFLPGIGFLIMLVFWYLSRNRGSFVQSHYREAINASLVSGVLLIIVGLFILLAGGFASPWTWVILIIYFTLCHSVLILLGVFGYTRAHNGRSFRFFSIASWRG